MTDPEPGSAPVLLISRIVALTVRVMQGIGSAGILGCLLLVCWSVVTRYVLNQPIAWVDDAVSFALVGIVSLSVAEVTRRGDHIAMDLVTAAAGPGLQRAVGVLTALLLIVLSGAGVWQCWQSAAMARMIGITIGGTLEWPVWWLIATFAFGLVMIGLVALDMLVRLLILRTPLHRINPEEMPE